MDYQIKPSHYLQGEITIPGDKSISHRALLCSAIADGISTIDGLLEAQDCMATIHALQALGVPIKQLAPTQWQINGVSRFGLQSPTKMIDLGNAGTAMRLLTGLLSGANISALLTGDASLQKRPMQRIIDPLQAMGAKISAEINDFPPLSIYPNEELHAIDYTLPLASAQVKSCILLAGLYAQGTTIIREPIICRNHTELLLQQMGALLHQQENTIMLESGPLKAIDITIPADISSAAFFMVGASISPNSHIILPKVGINPTRKGIINFLQQMGAAIALLNISAYGNEPIADIVVKPAPLHGIDILPTEIPHVIDELPALLIAAACAQGPTRVFGAAELAVKESNRLLAMQKGLQTLGVTMLVENGNITVLPQPFRGGVIDSFHDHRIAMAFSMAALCCEQNITIRHCENVATSFPNFMECATKAGLNIFSS